MELGIYTFGDLIPGPHSASVVSAGDRMGMRLPEPAFRSGPQGFRKRSGVSPPSVLPVAAIIERSHTCAASVCNRGCQIIRYRNPCISAGGAINLIAGS
jgi:hypothetical protein